MKRIFTALLVLLLLAGGVYYAYSTNKEFKEFVRFVLNVEDVDSTVVLIDTLPPPVEVKEVPKEERKKIPKVLKRDKYHKLDEHARKTPMEHEKDFKTLAKYLTAPAKTEIEKARVLFTWVATHITYDDSTFNAGDYSKRDFSAKDVLEKRTAVCEGYSNILKELCQAAGLDAENISGYSKGYGYNYGDKFDETDHAWNAIKIDGRWRLFEPTWAAGYAENVNGRLVSTAKFEPYWFDVNPKEFLFTHLPKHAKWQLTGEEPVKLELYEKLPKLSSGFFQLGFDANEIYDAAVKRDVKAFVEPYSIDFPVKMVKAPCEKGLKRGEAVQFTIRSEYAEEIAIVEDGQWHYLKKEGNLFKLSHAPTGKQVILAEKINWYDEGFSYFAEYKVLGSDALSKK